MSLCLCSTFYLWGLYEKKTGLSDCYFLSLMPLSAILKKNIPSPSSLVICNPENELYGRIYMGETPVYYLMLSMLSKCNALFYWTIIWYLGLPSYSIFYVPVNDLASQLSYKRFENLVSFFGHSVNVTCLMQSAVIISQVEIWRHWKITQKDELPLQNRTGLF